MLCRLCQSISTSLGPSGQEEAQDGAPDVAVKSHESRMTFAQVVERKGPVDVSTRRLVADFDLDWLEIAEIGVQIRLGANDSRSQAGLFENQCPQSNL